SFAHQRKACAYLQASYPTTHPIVADIVDLEATRQNNDGITYAKGTSVIKHLFHNVDESAFLHAYQTYFTRFAFGIAELADFLEILEEVSNRDMHEWSAAWLQTPGPATLHATVEPTGAVTIRQDSTDPLTGETVLRPHHIFVSIFTLDDNDQLVSSSESEVVIPTGETSVIVEDLTIPADQPRVVLVNHHDQT